MKLNIALVVQEGMKRHLHKLVIDHKTMFSDNCIISTSGTAKYLHEMTDLLVNEVVHSGHEGGDIKIANKIIEGDIDVLIFLLNTQQSFPHNNDVLSLIRMCNFKNILLATNVKTADVVLSSISR
jgi:methylglyoxal synthase